MKGFMMTSLPGRRAASGPLQLEAYKKDIKARDDFEWAASRRSLASSNPLS